MVHWRARVHVRCELIWTTCHLRERDADASCNSAVVAAEAGSRCT